MSGIGVASAGLARGVKAVAADPRTKGVLRAGPRVARFLTSSRQRTAAAAGDDTVVPVSVTPLLAAQALLDELLIAAFKHPDLLPGVADYEPAAAELAETRAQFEARGLLADPAAYHPAPPCPTDIHAAYHHGGVASYEALSWQSGWAPADGEPGRERWLAHEANRTARAWISRAPGRDRGMWMVCSHGFGMGSHAAMDLRAFRAARLHRMGIHVAHPLLPLHGARSSGRVRGEDLMTIDMVDSMHGVAQAVWDLRTMIRWLREAEGATRIGLMGLSLGGLVVALCAALEDDLSCVIAGIPVVDLPDLFRRHSPSEIADAARQYGVLGEVADDVHRVVSPLALPCRVPKAHRYLFAGLGDRMSTFGQARRLWLQWDRPELEAYHGGHVGFYFAPSVSRFVRRAVSESFPETFAEPASEGTSPHHPPQP